MRGAKKTVLALVCGGPSYERGISINSARVVVDHLGGCDDIEICGFFMRSDMTIVPVNVTQLYANTAEDFAFQLSETTGSSLEDFARHVKADLVFSVIHGVGGEDGVLFQHLEKHGVPHVGSFAQVCAHMLSKHESALTLHNHGLGTLDRELITLGDSEVVAEKVRNFMHKHPGRIVVKPNMGGSSIGVAVCDTVELAMDHALYLLSDPQCGRDVVLEPFVGEGIEFTVVVLQSHDGDPVALVPVEIEMQEEGALYDYRRKYLPTLTTRLHCPARFADEQVDAIRLEAERIFRVFGCHDMVRFDGWVLPGGRVIWTDLNPISGVEQNSFVFLQSALLGMTHKMLLRYVVNSALKRHDLPVLGDSVSGVCRQQQKVFVLCGG